MDSTWILFDRRDDKGKAAMIFTYWIRTEISSNNTLYYHLMDVMLNFFFVPQFEWDPKLKRELIILSEDRKQISQPLKHGWSTVCARNLLSSETVSKVCWELTLIRLGDDGMNLKMGYIDANQLDRGKLENECKKQKQLGEKAGEVALYVGKGGHPRIRRNAQTTDIVLSRSITFHLKIGDTFRLDFDFGNGECNAFYNDTLLGELSSNISGKIALAASMFWKGSAYETTMFEAT